MSTTLTTAAAALADVLAQENAALAALDLAAAAALLEAKQAAAEAFAAAQAEDAPPLDGRDLAVRLRELAAQNRQLLERAIRVQRRVLGIIAKALPPPAAPRYGASGTLRAGAVAPVIVSARV